MEGGKKLEILFIHTTLGRCTFTQV